jgi:ABC-type iron transport system FetAB permease component
MNLLNARTFAQVNGIASVALAIVGFVLPNVFGLFTMEIGHTVVHILIAAISLYFGYGNVSEEAVKNFAKVFGITYLALAVVGFVSGTVFGLVPATFLNLEMLENVLHLALGSWATYVGFKND